MTHPTALALARDERLPLTPDTREPAVLTRDLRMRYGDTDVLRGVDLRIEAGEVTALLGPNGAGKTTTIEILEGIRRRSSGDVRVLGIDPDDATEEWQSRIGVVLQSWRDHRRWRAGDLLTHIASYYRPFARRDRATPFEPDELLDAVGLTDKATTRVGRLSGGQRRRLDVAIGLVGNPELLFLDEPTVGFDPEARQEFHALLQSIARTRDTAVVLTTHDLAEAELLSDSVAILVGGQIVARGSTADIAREHARGTRVTHRVCGDLRSTVVDGDATDHVRTLLRDSRITDLAVRPRSLEDAYLQMIDALDEKGSPA
ncbi:ABC transporter ATP-binding protein [Rhodococcus sp. BP-241]|uniref:ABC transporter ATP-binding protein n=1 Tax=Rhodococcus sp. BP-241 TaxID=2739441 RepID=UPI001C9AAEEB|nr:ABC transporter ATP-binding protein [Rhodococcus sp. BP-241]MBY6706172.1 ABC transporter ATP-binding protein [Rhodococcus sp. BP-241]